MSIDEMIAEFEQKHPEEMAAARKRVKQWIENGDFVITDITHLFVPANVRLREDCQ